jgi:predicted dipeptidase
MTHRAWLAVVLALALSLAPRDGADATPLAKADVDALVAAEQATPSADFDAMLASAARMTPSLAPSVAAYRKRAPLKGDRLVQISRLLGVYNRVHNQGAVIATIEQMVSVRTVRNEQVPPHDDPAMIDFGKLVEAMARAFGLDYRNVDGRVFEVKLAGAGSEEFGILTHADVVPAVAAEWVLSDGTRLDPFTVTRVGDRLYGRGTIDDKGSIAAALYAMKVVKDSGLPLRRTIRLMIDTTEETGGDGFKYYRDRTPLPQYNVVLDSKYPAVVAEKGSGSLSVFFPVQAGNARSPAIVAMTGAASANTVPQTASATLRGGDPSKVASTLAAARAAFIKRYADQGGPFTIDVTQASDHVEVKVTGVSAHGSRPEEGVNPVPRLAMFLLQSGLPLDRNHYARAAKYIADLYGTGYLGESMGMAYQDAFMGPLTMSPTLIRERDGRLEVVANVRMPRGRAAAELTRAVAAKIEAWGAANQVALEIQHKQDDWMARDPKGAWLATLLNIFGETTGREAKPVPTAGSTTAKLLPNAINFGPAMPGKKYTAHNAMEYKEVPDLDLDMQMFTEMLVRLGTLQRMQ